MGEAFVRNNCGTIEKRGKPKVERVVSDNGHKNQPPSGEGKVSSGAAEVPSHDGTAPPHSLHNPRSESFCSEHQKWEADEYANSRLSPFSLSRKTAVRLDRSQKTKKNYGRHPLQYCQQNAVQPIVMADLFTRASKFLVYFDCLFYHNIHLNIYGYLYN